MSWLMVFVVIKSFNPDVLLVNIARDDAAAVYRCQACHRLHESVACRSPHKLVYYVINTAHQKLIGTNVLSAES